MQCSLIGNLVDATLIVDAIDRDAGYCVGPVHGRGALLERLTQRFPSGAVRVDNAEEALYDRDSDVVIVAESDPDAAMTFARQASQADKHVLVVPPPDASTAFSYELHLLLDEGQRGILVLSGHWYLPETLLNAVPDIRDVEFGLPSPADDPDHRATVLYAIDQVAAMGFGMTQVTVLDVADAADLTTSRQIVFAESPRVTSSRPGVSINCSRSVDSCRLRSLSSPKTLDRTLIIPTLNAELPQRDAAALIGRVFTVLTRRDVLQQAMESFSESLQLRQSVDDSIRRRRTIDIYVDGLTERNAFKTQMTAMGCGVLTWVLLGMVGYLLVGQLDPPVGVLHVLRILWIAPIVVFLAAQFLLPLARR